VVYRSASTLRGWLCGVLVGIVAVFLRASLQPVMGDQLPFSIAFPATVLAAVLWGAGPGIVVAALTAAAVASLLIPPYLVSANRPLQVGAFLVGSILISLLCGRLRAQPERRPMSAEEQAIETPLTAWLRAALWGAFLIPLVAFVFIAWWGYERARHDAELAVTHASDLAYRHAQRVFDVALEIARRTDEAAPADDQTVGQREAEIHRRLADIASGVPSVVDIDIWDADGRPLARSDVFPVDPKALVSDRAYFQEQKNSRKPLGVSEVIKGRVSGLDVFNATLRRATADGRFAGVVAVSMAPRYFRDYYESLTTEQPDLATFALIRLDGEIIARWPPTVDGRTHVPPDSLVLRRIVAGQTSGNVLVPESAGRETRISAFRRLDHYPLYVVAGVSRAAMFAGWARFIALLAAILLPTSAGLVYVTWVALKKTQREALTSAELQDQIRRRAIAEQNMVQSQKLETLAVVTGGVAHDFNNLLAIVNASLHILKRSQPELVDNKQIKDVTRAVQAGVRLTRQLLSFTRKQALRPETIDLQSWLPATEGLIQTTLGASVTWQLRVEPDTKPVNVDMGELELALINLVVNARHAMPKGGALTVHASNAAQDHGFAKAMVGISVADTGVGIPSELLTKVFEPFFSTRTKGAGSGLGLSQVQGFCSEAGGTVRIDSVVGEGTTVWMYLPASSDVSVAQPIETPVAIQVSGRVLLVEDNEDVAATTEMVLRTAGLEVVRRASADAALSYLRAIDRLPDAVLSDIAMPGSMNGIELAFALREKHPSLPVLLTTGYAEQLDEAVAGGLSVLPKPVAPEELLDALKAVIPQTVGSTGPVIGQRASLFRRDAGI
jgi:two-component system NtrC family sensor kinase